MEEKYTRECPSCGDEMSYTNRGNRNQAERKGRLCKECAKLARSERMKGEGNHFFGKKHSEAFKSNLSSERKGKHFSPSTQFKKGQQTLNTKPHFDCWKLKYGESEAIKRFEAEREKHRVNATGSNNNMYGKPSPQGSGNGWSGWYKNWYFRSLTELSFMIKVIERFKFTWVSKETKTDAIPYIGINGQSRNYFPDFLLNNKYLIEIKPKKLWNTPSVQAKAKGAIEYCNNNGYKYKLLDIELLSLKDLSYLYDTNQIKFLEKYENKYLQLLAKSK